MRAESLLFKDFKKAKGRSIELKGNLVIQVGHSWRRSGSKGSGSHSRDSFVAGSERTIAIKGVNSREKSLRGRKRAERRCRDINH